jgi:hypothetical protein
MEAGAGRSNGDVTKEEKAWRLKQRLAGSTISIGRSMRRKKQRHVLLDFMAAQM